MCSLGQWPGWILVELFGRMVETSLRWSFSPWLQPEIFKILNVDQAMPRMTCECHLVSSCVHVFASHSKDWTKSSRTFDCWHRPMGRGNSCDSLFCMMHFPSFSQNTLVWTYPFQSVPTRRRIRGMKAESNCQRVSKDDGSPSKKTGFASLQDTCYTSLD